MGADNIGASYSGDTNYTTGTGTSPVTVTSSGSSGTFSLGTPSTPTSVNPGGSASSTISVTGSNGYAGAVSFTCSLTSPTSGTDLPGCTVGGGVTLNSSTTSGTVTFTVTTTAPSTSGRMELRGLPGWLGAAGGTSLAVLIFFGIPKRRRSLRSFLGMLVVLAVLGSLSACGGGGSNGGGGGNSDPGTSAGNYTFTVTGTGSPAGGGPYTKTFNVTVN